MKILVTGANGYLGQGIVKAIINKGHEVIATDFMTNYVDVRAKKLHVIYLRLKIHMTILVSRMYCFI
jgi:nucleoside-diphosphate-sugar epimerase